MCDRKWLIRQLHEDEVDVFKTIRLEALQREPDAFASLYEDWVEFTDAQWRERMNVSIFVAFDAGKPIGIMALKRSEPHKMRHRATLAMVYVSRHVRGLRVAEAILKAICDHAMAEQVTQIELVVNVANATALRFYQRHQFIETGRVAKGFRTNDRDYDEVLMVRELRSE
jgi:ribosomal protein S18 acetylase RimI-like enzyme